MAKARFICPDHPEHTQFYLRRFGSEVFDVSAAGVVAAEPKEDSYEFDRDGRVCCCQCEELHSGIVAATDTKPCDDLLQA